MKRIFIFLITALMTVGAMAEDKRISPTICGLTVGQTTSKEILDKVESTCMLTVIDVQEKREVYLGDFNVEGFKMSVMSVELSNDTIYQINFYEQSPYVNYWKQCKEQATTIRDKYANHSDYYHSTRELDSLLILDKSDGTTYLSFACFPKKMQYSLINLRMHEVMHQKMMDELQRAANINPETTVTTIPATTISRDLSRYKYVFVVPTSGETSEGGVYSTGYGVYGGKTRTVNPSEIITGYLMKLGYSVLPSIVPELAEQTIVVIYGNTGASSVWVAKRGAIIQIRNAKTHDLIAASEAEGTSLGDETSAVKRAIYIALDNIFIDN